MLSRLWPIPPLALLLAGCASPPPECEYADVADRVHRAACHGEVTAPATLPPEAELSGPHPVGFYVQLALERNPELLAAQRAVAAEAETIPQVTSLEDPMLTDTFWPDPAHSPQTASGRMGNSLMLTQEFPWLSKLRVRGEVAEQETKIALTQLTQAQLEVTEEVHLAYYDISYYQQAVRITEANEALLADLVEFARIRFRTGGSQQDVLRAELELERLRNQLIELRRQLRVAQADLAGLLHASPDVEPLAAEPLVLPPSPRRIERLYEVAVHCRPELQERLHAIVRDQRRRELAALDYNPDFSAGASWDYMTTDQAIAPTADGFDNFGLIVGVSLPVWRDRLRAGVREAEHRAVQSARSYDAERDDTFRQIRRLIAQADASERQIRLFRESIVPKAEQTLRVSIAEYRTGGVSFLQVIDNYSELLTFQIQLARLETGLGQALASLERVVGCQLAALPDAAAAPGPVLAPAPDELPPPAPAPEGRQPDDDRGEGREPGAVGARYDVPRRVTPVGYDEPDRTYFYPAPQGPVYQVPHSPVPTSHIRSGDRYYPAVRGIAPAGPPAPAGSTWQGGPPGE